MKATYGELTHVDGTVEPREIFKDPITDDGTKKSKKGLLSVERLADKSLVCHDQQSWYEEQGGMLQTVFLDGEVTRFETLSEIRMRISG